jgi:beta-glucosidase
MGLSPLMEGEEGDAILSTENGDRSDIGLPEVQSEFIKRLIAHGKKVVLVLTGGSPIALGDLAELVTAIVWVWYPGQEGGRAVADVLFGRANPSGRLPVTFPRSTEQLPPFEDYAMHGRTYRYADWEPLYPFGFGLSYSHFAYSNLEFGQKVISSGEALQANFKVTNVSDMEDEHVVQFYLSDLEATVDVPYSTLIGFQRIRLAPHESVQAQFTVTPDMLMLVDDDGIRRLESGTFRLTIGGCSPGERGVTLGAPVPVSAEFQVVA